MGKKRRNPVSDEQIVEHYRNCHSAYKTAVALGIGDTTVYRVLMKLKEPRSGLKEWRLKITRFRGQEKQIREMYEQGATYDMLSQHFGTASVYAFKHAIRRAGGKLRDNPVPTLKNGELTLIKQMNAAGIGQTGISLALNRSQSFISRQMRRNGIQTLTMSGENHGQWKGGRWIDNNGYVRVWLDDNDILACMANGDGYVLEHRLALARKLGRPLLSTETVHHIDGDRLNNTPDNLQIRQGKHGKNVVMCCADCGSHNLAPTQIAEHV